MDSATTAASGCERYNGENEQNWSRYPGKRNWLAVTFTAKSEGNEKNWHARSQFVSA